MTRHASSVQARRLVALGIIAIFAATPNAAADSGVVRSLPPQDPAYWAHYKEHRNETSVSVLVNGKDTAHLEAVLAELKNLKQSGVTVNRLAVIGRTISSEHTLGSSLEPQSIVASAVRKERQLPSENNSLGLLLREIALQNTGVEDLQAFANELQLTFSPCWIVSAQGTVSVIEGARSLKPYFDSSGSWIGPQSLTAKLTFRNGTKVDHTGKSAIRLFTTSTRDTRSTSTRDTSSTAKAVLNNPDPKKWNVEAFQATFSNAAQVFSSIEPPENAKGTFDALPTCSEEQTWKVPVPSDAASNLAFNTVIYDYLNTSQRALAQTYPQSTIAYVPGDLQNPYRTTSDQLPAFARLLKPPCLPTRVRTKLENGVPVLEYRTGKAAWSKD